MRLTAEKSLMKPFENDWLCRENSICSSLPTEGFEITSGENKKSVPKPKDCSRCGLPRGDEAGDEVVRKDLERKKAGGVLDMQIEDGEFRP